MRARIFCLTHHYLIDHPKKLTVRVPTPTGYVHSPTGPPCCSHCPIWLLLCHPFFLLCPHYNCITPTLLHVFLLCSLLKICLLYHLRTPLFVQCHPESTKRHHPKPAALVPTPIVVAMVNSLPISTNILVKNKIASNS